MAKGRDRPRKEPKRKPKEKAPKHQQPVTPAYQPPQRQVEVIKPKRKEREQEPEPEHDPGDE